jgi:hypothetical protein
MSNSSVNDSRSPVGRIGASSVSSVLLGPLKGAAFWAAIALPFLHLPLLVTGLDSPTTLGAFVALLALNVVALLVGHPHLTDGD